MNLIPCRNPWESCSSSIAGHVPSLCLSVGYRKAAMRRRVFHQLLATWDAAMRMDSWPAHIARLDLSVAHLASLGHTRFILEISLNVMKSCSPKEGDRSIIEICFTCVQLHCFQAFPLRASRRSTFASTYCKDRGGSAVYMGHVTVVV